MNTAPEKDKFCPKDDCLRLRSCRRPHSFLESPFSQLIHSMLLARDQQVLRQKQKKPESTKTTCENPISDRLLTQGSTTFFIEFTLSTERHLNRSIIDSQMALQKLQDFKFQ